MENTVVENILSTIVLMNDKVKDIDNKELSNEFYRMKNEVLNGLVNNMVCNFKILNWELQEITDGVVKHALVEFIAPSGKTYVFHRPLKTRNSFAQCLSFVGIQIPEADEEWVEYSRNETCKGSPCDVCDLPLLAKWYQIFKLQRYLELSCWERTHSYLNYATQINNSINKSNKLFNADITINDIFNDIKNEFDLANSKCKTNGKDKLKSLLVCKGNLKMKSFNRNQAKTVSKDLHNEMMKTMSAFSDNGKPKVGIFWYNCSYNKLFGVEKGDADLYINEVSPQTYPKSHKTYWIKNHKRAIAKNKTNSIFYKECNYTLIPRGCVFVRPDGTFYVMVGDWYDGVINGKRVFDKDKFRELICDEFNLPEDFEFIKDEHWNIGQCWYENKIE